MQSNLCFIDKRFGFRIPFVGNYELYQSAEWLTLGIPESTAA